MKKFQDYFYVWSDTLSKFAVEGKLTSAIFSEISSDIENEFKQIASRYFAQHTVIFINNAKKDTTYGEILHVGPVNARDVIIDTITQSSIKPAVKI